MITEQDWEKLKREADHRCLCCGSSEFPLTKDHVIPVSIGGEDIPQNLQPLCGFCNSEKGDEIRDYRGSLKFQGKKEGPSRWYPIKHAANILNKSPSTIRGWIRKDSIPHISGSDGRKYVWIGQGLSAVGYQLTEVDEQLTEMMSQLHKLKNLVSKLSKEKNRKSEIKIPQELEEWRGK